MLCVSWSSTCACTPHSWRCSRRRCMQRRCARGARLRRGNSHARTRASRRCQTGGALSLAPLVATHGGAWARCLLAYRPTCLAAKSGHRPLSPPFAPLAVRPHVSRHDPAFHPHPTPAQLMVVLARCGSPRHPWRRAMLDSHLPTLLALIRKVPYMGPLPDSLPCLCAQCSARPCPLVPGWHMPCRPPLQPAGWGGA